MKLEWHEIEPGTHEARVGDWLLEVGRHDDGLPWTLWVGLLNERERRGATPMCGTTYRRTVTGSLDEAQRAAVALAIEKCAPFVATARAEAALAEREACAARLEESAKLLDGLAAECMDGSESRRIYETQAEVIRAATDAIRARSNATKAEHG